MATTFHNKTDNAQGTLLGDITDVSSSITMTSGDGSLFPSGNFVVTIDSEKILVTTRTGDALTTITRGYDSTAASTHSDGADIKLNVITKHFTDIETAINTAEDDIDTNTTNIATNTSDIADNTADIATNTSDITDLESADTTHAADTTTHGTTGDIVGTSDTQTLTNKTITDSDSWHCVGDSGEPAFANSWVNYSSSAYSNAAFRKDSMGYVHLTGLIKDGTLSVAAFTLPAGYRPDCAAASGNTTDRLLFGTISPSGDSTPADDTIYTGRVDIFDDGSVIINSISSNQWIALDGISFYAG